MLIKEIRNAFFHSAYSLLTGEFVIHGGKGVAIKGVVEKVIPPDWLRPRLEAGINLGIGLIDALVARRAAYKTSKTIPATRAEGFGDITLIVDDRGLVGFKG